MTQEQREHFQTLVETLTTESLEYWFKRLDFTEDCLRLPDGQKIGRIDMQVLHYFLHGYPRKVIGRKLGFSVKAIEKRLTKMRVALAHRGCECYSLHGCVRHYNLTAFLMAKPDWFDGVAAIQLPEN